MSLCATVKGKEKGLLVLLHVQIEGQMASQANHSATCLCHHHGRRERVCVYVCVWVCLYVQEEVSDGG